MFTFVNNEKNKHYLFKLEKFIDVCEKNGFNLTSSSWNVMNVIGLYIRVSDNYFYNKLKYNFKENELVTKDFLSFKKVYSLRQDDDFFLTFEKYLLSDEINLSDIEDLLIRIWKFFRIEKENSFLVNSMRKRKKVVSKFVQKIETFNLPENFLEFHDEFFLNLVECLFFRAAILRELQSLKGHSFTKFFLFYILMSLDKEIFSLTSEV